ncbi:cytochrome P450 [Leeuwenhoekiella sp. W20_SRS_FM14]|uniref:cytochrome P450 n=1 Tax=Leeuwenhoekiella sp. W20_SRS_FM14 TaxID=3240270 RepID=UPI003F9A95E2
MQKIPQVSRLMFIKSARAILKNPLPFHKENFKLKGNTFRLKLGISESVVFSKDPLFAQYVLQKNQKNYKKSPIQTKDLAKYLGQGLLTSNGTHWAKQRKLIQPAFHKKQLATLIDKIEQAVISEIENIEVNKPFDIFPIFNDLAFQTVVKALFSSAVDQKSINRLQYITETAQEMMVRELRQPYLIWWFKFSGQLNSTLKLTQEARQILKDLVKERQNQNKRQDDLLDMLLDARYDDGSAMAEEQLIDEILILFTAGHETTSNALTFTAELLARHPEVQDKLYAEISELDNENDLLLKIKSLQYVEQVVNESMRLYPPAYFIDRVSIAADSFSSYEIAQNTSLLFSIYEIHRDANFWEDPNNFNPDRFIEDTSIKYSPYYYPFGAGPRMCIGNNFAMYEMILAIAELVKRFKIEFKASPIEINPLITLKPKDAILQFTKREN